MQAEINQFISLVLLPILSLSWLDVFNAGFNHNSEQWPDYTGGSTGEAKRNDIFTATSAENKRALLQQDGNHIQEFLSQSYFGFPSTFPPRQKHQNPKICSNKSA